MIKQQVLCEYSKFRIESNSYFSIRFDLKRAQLFEIFEYLPSPISYLFNRMMPIFRITAQLFDLIQNEKKTRFAPHYKQQHTWQNCSNWLKK